jgi:hypothetical protein
MCGSDQAIKYHAFVSYSKDNLQARVSRLVRRLERDGLDIWYDKDDLVAGDSLARINEALSTSRSLVLCLGSDIDPFGWVAHEYSYFRYSITPPRRVILLRTDDSPLPASLNQYVYINWRRGSRSAYQRILQAIRHDVEPAQDESPPPSDTLTMQGLPLHLSGWNGPYQKSGKRRNGRDVWERPEHWYMGFLPLRIIGVKIWFDGKTWVLHRDGDPEGEVMRLSNHSDWSPKGPWEGGASVTD